MAHETKADQIQHLKQRVDALWRELENRRRPELPVGFMERIDDLDKRLQMVERTVKDLWRKNARY